MAGMIMKSTRIPVVLLVLFLAVGCAQMQEHEAATLAKNYARENNIDTASYVVSTERIGREWQVHFVRDGKQEKPAPGDFFTVFVDTELKAVTKIVPGK